MFHKDIWYIVINYLDAKDRCTLTQISKYINIYIGNIIKKFQYNKVRVQYVEFSRCREKSYYHNIVSSYKVDYRNRIQGTLTKLYIDDSKKEGNLLTNTIERDITIFGTMDMSSKKEYRNCMSKSWHYIDNQKHGWSKELYSKRFMWKNLLHGPFIDNGYYKSRKIYKLDVLHGYYIDSGDCEDILEGNYVNGYKHGPWIKRVLYEPERVLYIDIYEMGVLKNRSGYYISKKRSIGYLRYYTEFKISISDAGEIEIPDDLETTYSERDTTDYCRYHIPNITQYYRRDGTQCKIIEED